MCPSNYHRKTIPEILIEVMLQMEKEDYEFPEVKQKD